MKIVDLYEGATLRGYNGFMEQWGEEISRSLSGNMQYPDGFEFKHFQAIYNEIATSNDCSSIYRGVMVPREYLTSMVPNKTHLGVFWSTSLSEAKHCSGGQYQEDPRFDDEDGAFFTPSSVLAVYHGKTQFDQLDIQQMIGARVLWPHEKEVRLKRKGKVVIDSVIISPSVKDKGWNGEMSDSWCESNPWFDFTNEVTLGTYLA